LRLAGPQGPRGLRHPRRQADPDVHRLPGARRAAGAAGPDLVARGAISVIPVLVTGIQLSARSGACGSVDRGDKPRDDYGERAWLESLSSRASRSNSPASRASGAPSPPPPGVMTT